MLGWYDRRLIRPLWVNLPKDGTVFSLSDGFIHHPGAGKALDELARRDGFRIECVGYSGVYDFRVVGPSIPFVHVSQARRAVDDA